MNTFGSDPSSVLNFLQIEPAALEMGESRSIRVFWRVLYTINNDRLGDGCIGVDFTSSLNKGEIQQRTRRALAKLR